MSLKLLIVSQRFWPEENDINLLAGEFADAGIKVDVLCGRPFYPEGGFYEGYRVFGHKEEKYGDVSVYRACELPKSGSFASHPLINYVSFSFSSRFVMRKLKKNQYDAVFIYQTSPVFQGKHALKLAGHRRIRSVMYVAELWPEAIYKEMDLRDPLLRKIFKVISFRQYRRAGQLVTGSVEIEKYLVREVVQTPGKVKYIPPLSAGKMIFDNKDDSIRQRYIGSFNILYMGDIRRENSFDVILDASQKLIIMGLRDVRIIIAGDGPGLAALNKEIEKRGLFDMVLTQGQVPKEKLAAYVNAADALICADLPGSTVSYAPPKKIVDYMGFGKPILAAADTEGKNIIKKAKCGFVSDPGDAQSLAENIKQLYMTPKEKLTAMGNAAALYKARNFDPDICARQILEQIFPE